MKSSDLFPDMHQKMCKKIAQLTKVIYHLNTQNEDMTYQMEGLKQKHQLALQQVIDDNLLNFEQYKITLEQRKSQIDLDEKLRYQERVFNEEKAATLKELNHFKYQCKQNEDKLVNEHHEKYNKLRTEMVEMGDLFDIKCKEYALENDRLRHEITELNSNHQLLFQQKVNEYNQLQTKYNNLEIDISKLIQSNDQEKIDLKIKYEQEKVLLIDEYDIRIRNEINKTIQDLNYEKTMALEQLTTQYELKINTIIKDYTQEIHELNEKIALSESNIEVLKIEKQQIITEMNRHIENLNKMLGDKMGGHEEQMKSIMSSLHNITQEKNNLQIQVIEREEEINRQKTLISQKNTEIQRLDDNLRLLETEIARFRLELENSHHQYQILENEYQIQLKDKDKIITNLRGEINQIGEKLNKINEEYKDIIRSHKKSCEEYDEKITQLHTQKSILENSISSLNTQLENNKVKTVEEYQKLQLDIKQQQIEYENKLSLSLQEHDVILNQFKLQYDTTIQQHQQELLELNMKYEDMISSYEDKIKIIHTKNEEKIQVILKENEETMNTMKVNYTQQVTQLQLQITELQHLLDTNTENSTTQQSQLSSTISRYQQDINKCQAIITDLTAINKEYDTQIQTLQAQMIENEKNINERYQLEIKELKEEFRIEREKRQHENNNEIERLHHQYRDEIDNMNKSHTKEIDEIQAVHTTRINELMSTITNLESNSTDKEKDLLSQINQLNMQFMDFQETTKLETEQLKLSHVTKINQLRDKWQNETTIELNILRQQYDKDIIDLKSDGDKRFMYYEQLMTQTMTQQKEELIQLHIQEKEILQGQLLSEYQQQVNGLQKRMDDKVAQYDKEIQTLHEEIIIKDNVYQESVSQIQHMKELHLQQEVTWNTQQQSLINEYTQKIDMIHEDYALQLHTLKSSHDKDINQMNISIDEIKNQHELVIQQLHESISQLEYKVKMKESLPEDVEKIRQLQAEIVQKNMILDKLNDEFQTVKRELFNREEVYNQKFNRSPTVGVMQVIKNNNTNNNNNNNNNSMLSGGHKHTNSTPILGTTNISNTTTSISGSNGNNHSGSGDQSTRRPPPPILNNLTSTTAASSGATKKDMFNKLKTSSTHSTTSSHHSNSNNNSSHNVPNTSMNKTIFPEVATSARSLSTGSAGGGINTSPRYG